MTSHRPYRVGMPRDTALEIIAREAGRQFDVHFVDIFLELGLSKKLDHVIGHSDDGIPLQSCPMCGPTLVLRRESAAGHHIYCRNCGDKFELIEKGHGLLANTTGQKGSAADIEPEADIALIARTVEAVASALPVEAMVEQKHGFEGELR